MTSSASGWWGSHTLRLRAKRLDDQHRNAGLLVLGNLIAAATGLLFWLLLARVARLPASEIGIGYAIVGLGATIGVVAKGGLDTALLRSVPWTTREGGAQLLRFGILVGGVGALALSAVLGFGAGFLGLLPQMAALDWILVGAIALLLIVTWLQDAYHLAEGNATFGVKRNLVLSIARIGLLLPVIALAWYEPVAITWLLAVAASALVATVVRARASARPGRVVSRTEFLRRSWRNEAGSAFEFLPGLILAPIVLLVSGPTPAGHFAIVWAAASLLFVLSAAIGRSALAEMVKKGAGGVSAAINRGAWQHAVSVAPAALVGVVFAPAILSVFGRQYATEGATTFAILCASILFVAPSYLYLTVLRAGDRTGPLVAFPALMLVTLVLLTPLLEAPYGLPGVGAAWLLANAPFGLFAMWKLTQRTGKVLPIHPPRGSARPPPPIRNERGPNRPAIVLGWQGPTARPDSRPLASRPQLRRLAPHPAGDAIPSTAGTAQSPPRLTGHGREPPP